MDEVKVVSIFKEKGSYYATLPYEEKITLQGNQKHGTKHNEYICYQCGYTNDRDENAVLNLLALAK